MLTPKYAKYGIPSEGSTSLNLLKFRILITAQKTV